MRCYSSTQVAPSIRPRDISSMRFEAGYRGVLETLADHGSLFSGTKLPLERAPQWPVFMAGGCASYRTDDVLVMKHRRRLHGGATSHQGRGCPPLVGEPADSAWIGTGYKASTGGAGWVRRPGGSRRPTAGRSSPKRFPARPGGSPHQPHRRYELPLPGRNHSSPAGRGLILREPRLLMPPTAFPAPELASGRVGAAWRGPAFTAGRRSPRESVADRDPGPRTDSGYALRRYSGHQQMA